MHLALNSGVTDLLKMLTYLNVCCAFASAGCLALDRYLQFLKWVLVLFHRNNLQERFTKGISDKLNYPIPNAGGELSRN